MTTITMTEILGDLRAVDEITRRYERRYWLRSADFYELYSQGMLDDEEHTEDITVWAAYYEINLDREQDFQQLSRERLHTARDHVQHGVVRIAPPEPSLGITPA